MLMTVFSFAIPMTWYAVNYDFIKTELCINRHIPGSDCDGTCQLKKKINDHHDHESSEEAKVVNHSPRIFLFFSESEEHISGMQEKLRRYIVNNEDLNNLFSLKPPTPPPQIG